VENFRRGKSKKGSQFKVSIDFIGASPRKRKKKKREIFRRKGRVGKEEGEWNLYRSILQIEGVENRRRLTLLQLPISPFFLPRGDKFSLPQWL
jgi:hypothetical protein